MIGTLKGMAISVFLIFAITVCFAHGKPTNATFVSGIKEETDKVWLFAVNGIQKPYSFMDDKGQLVGFDVDLVSKICQLASKKCKMVLAQFTECVFSSRDLSLAGRGLMSEWFDGCLRYVSSIDRTGAFDFTDPYLETASSFTVLPGNPSDFDPKLADYSNFTMTYLTGAVTNTRCLGRLGKKFGEIIIAENLPDAKRLLMSKKAHVLFSPRNRIPDLEVLPERLHCERGGAGVMTKKGSTLSSWWNPAYASMVSSGQYAQFCRQASVTYKATFKCLNVTEETHQVPDNAPAEKTWLFAVSGRRKPFHFLDGEGYLIGFNLDFIQAVCQLAGKKCEAVLVEFKECTFTDRNINYPGRGLMDGWFDACIGYADSLDRQNGFDFTDAYLKSDSTYSVIPDNPSGFDPDMSDYSNFTFVHLNGAYTNAACLKRLGKIAKNIVIAKNLPDAKRILFNREADVLFSPRAVIPDLETFPQRVHCEQTGTSVMVKKGNPLPGWWNVAYKSFVQQGGYKKLCKDSTVKYNSTFECFDVTEETDQVPDNAPAEKTWLFAVSGRRKPFNFLDGEGYLIGFDLDFIQAVCQLAGKKCEAVLVEFKECAFTDRNINYPGRGLMDGWFDACTGYSDSLDRQNGFDFTDAYLKSYTTYSVIPDNPSGFDPDMSDYSNFTFVHLNGAYTNAACLKRLGKIAKNIVIAENLPDAKRILFNREADVLFSPRAVIPDLETFPQRVHCEQTGTSMMVKKGNPLPGWWNVAYKSFVQQGGYKKLCKDSTVKYNFPIKCFE